MSNSKANGQAIAQLIQTGLGNYSVLTLRGVLVSDGGESITSYKLAANIIVTKEGLVHIEVHPQYEELLPLMTYSADASPEEVYLVILKVIHEAQAAEAAKLEAPKIILPGQ